MPRTKSSRRARIRHAGFVHAGSSRARRGPFGSLQPVMPDLLALRARDEVPCQCLDFNAGLGLLCGDSLVVVVLGSCVITSACKQMPCSPQLAYTYGSAVFFSISNLLRRETLRAGLSATPLASHIPYNNISDLHPSMQMPNRSQSSIRSLVRIESRRSSSRAKRGK